MMLSQLQEEKQIADKYEEEVKLEREEMGITLQSRGQGNRNYGGKKDGIGKVVGTPANTRTDYCTVRY